MKLNKAVVFSANLSNIPGLCSGANALAQESVAAVLGSREQEIGRASCRERV